MTDLDRLLTDIRACTHCAPQLPLGPRPVVVASTEARLLIVGQAPGTRVHATGIPWNDPSGDRLRQWLDIDRDTFYDASRIAIIPMGFCYPGRGKSGDLPPRPECATLWRERLHALLPRIELTLLIGQYAQTWYLGRRMRATLTETVADWATYAPDFLPLPHPSPRNQLWLRRNAWFEAEVVPELRHRTAPLLRPKAR
ncbi:uracil-DNA glycosylase family protein [Chitiniphilus eburneus]|uniref:Uracil-DNA glycosylase family protein n=1 Tax=Chitiniphilus eburneus TaxID=2571148 RepID=A0A4U0PZA9_9NEIS|nr:uracil-DNA glycosylase family protein [Chitiniphilus eburneus]TJZ68594.1 uracil-DNA glycosylase family protein [Chitiniphilus eburneus]